MQSPQLPLSRTLKGLGPGSRRTHVAVLLLAALAWPTIVGAENRVVVVRPLSNLDKPQRTTGATTEDPLDIMATVPGATEALWARLQMRYELLDQDGNVVDYADKPHVAWSVRPGRYVFRATAKCWPRFEEAIEVTGRALKIEFRFPKPLPEKRTLSGEVTAHSLYADGRSWVLPSNAEVEVLRDAWPDRSGNCGTVIARVTSGASVPSPALVLLERRALGPPAQAAATPGPTSSSSYGEVEKAARDAYEKLVVFLGTRPGTGQQLEDAADMKKACEHLSAARVALEALVEVSRARAQAERESTGLRRSDRDDPLRLALDRVVSAEKSLSFGARLDLPVNQLVDVRLVLGDTEGGRSGLRFGDTLYPFVWHRFRIRVQAPGEISAEMRSAVQCGCPLAHVSRPMFALSEGRPYVDDARKLVEALSRVAALESVPPAIVIADPPEAPGPTIGGNCTEARTLAARPRTFGEQRAAWVVPITIDRRPYDQLGGAEVGYREAKEAWQGRQAEHEIPNCAVAIQRLVVDALGGQVEQAELARKKADEEAERLRLAGEREAAKVARQQQQRRAGTGDSGNLAVDVRGACRRLQIAQGKQCLANQCDALYSSEVRACAKRRGVGCDESIKERLDEWAECVELCTALAMTQMSECIERGGP